MSTFWPEDLSMRAEATPVFDADGTDRVTIVGRVQRPGTVNSVEFIPSWNLTGADTNSRTYTLYNRGPAGAGTTAIATLAMASGVNLTKFAAKVIPVTAANAAILVGDVLEWESLHVGTGIPDPGGRIIVKQSLGS